MGTYFNPSNGGFRKASRDEIYVDKTGLINILNRTGLTFKQLLKDYVDTYKFCKDIDLDDCGSVEECDVYENDTHVVSRKSLTENKLRIFVESFNELKAESKFNEIVSSVESWYAIGWDVE